MIGVAGTLIGTLGGLAGGVIAARIHTQDSKAARDQARRDARGDAQRELLYDLQDALAAYARVVGRIWVQDGIATINGLLAPGEPRWLDAALNTEVFEADMRIRQLGLRIFDDDLRGRLTTFRNSGELVERHLVQGLDDCYHSQEIAEQKLRELLKGLL